jgi:hypothetical protein
MTLMLGKLYQALLQAGVSEVAARAAAEEVAQRQLDLARQQFQLRCVQIIWIIAGPLALLMACQAISIGLPLTN